MEIHPQISVKNRKTGEKQIYRMDQDRLTAGRDSSNYIVLGSPTVSRRHAEILREERQFFVRDLKSDNGTLLNERRLLPDDKTLLRSGDLIQIEDFEIQFRIPAGGSVEEIYETTDTDLLEIKMIKKLLRAMDRENAPSLEILEGPEAGRRFVLEGKNQEAAIGRDPACEFVIDSDMVSRKHVRLEKRFDAVTLHDLNSKNGTYVNREKVKEKKLSDGDIIHLGTLTLIFRNPQELSFDLAPPKVKKEEAGPSLPEARAAQRREEEPAPEVFQEPPEEREEAVQTPSRWSIAEILAILLGLAVLIGSVWGILKILK